MDIVGVPGALLNEGWGCDMASSYVF